MSVPHRELVDRQLGEASLLAVGVSDAVWSRGPISPYFQKSPTGWLANLYGGAQSGDDFAAVVIPVKEMFLRDLKEALWTYYFTSGQTFGINMVVWVHDPKDNDKRAEITQIGNTSGLAKASGWNAHELNTATVQFFYYGENVTDADGNASDLTAGTQYTWAQFQTDNVFKTWTISRITYEFGWEASGTFDDAWVADIKINGTVIRLQPDSGGTGRIGSRFFTTGTTSFAGTLAPKTPFRLLTVALKASAVLDTGEDFTLDVDAGRAATIYDVNLITEDLFVGSRTSYFATFGEGYEFRADDELDFAQANGSSDTLGLTLTYQTVFN